MYYMYYNIMHDVTHIDISMETIEEVKGHFLTALFLLLFNQGMLAKICFSSSVSSTGSSAAEGNRNVGNHRDEGVVILSSLVLLPRP